MKWSARAVAGCAVGTCLVSGLSACLSPTLPLPPPGEPDVIEVSADRLSVRLEGSHAIPGAEVTVLNDDLAGPPETRGVFADRNGGYVFLKVPIDLSVSSTNRLELWQRYGSDRSDVVRVTVPRGVAFGAAPLDDAGAATTSESGPIDAGTRDAAE